MDPVAHNASDLRGAEIALSLEIFRNVFARLAPGLELRSPMPTKILAFRDARSYAPYKSDPNSPIVGQFLRHPDGNFITLDADPRQIGAFDVIYHEFTHYLVDHNFPKVPRWFHEGLAEYYSTLTVEDDRVFLGRPVERHLRFLRYDNSDRKARSLSYDFSLRQVLTGEASLHGSKIPGFYAFSWALVHHLLSGNEERLDQIADFLLRLRDGEDPDDAFERAFDTRLDDLEETLRSYASKDDFPVASFELDDFLSVEIADIEPAEPQEIHYHLGDLLVRLGRLEWAELHFQEALEIAPDHAEARAGLALVRDHTGRFDEAHLLYSDAMELEPKDALTYLRRWGRHLIARLRPERGLDLVTAGRLAMAGELASTSDFVTDLEVTAAARDLDGARAAFARAVELDPEFATARVLLGIAHLLGESDPKPGITALEKARSWLPESDEINFFLLLLYLKDDDFKRASHLFASVFRDHADLELRRQAEEEIERALLLHRAAAHLEDDVDEALRLFDEAIAVTTNQDLRDRMAERLVELQERYSTP